MSRQRWMVALLWRVIGLLPAVVALESAYAQPAGGDDRPFAIRVVDEQTGRGVPLVELQATTGARYYTDSAGYIAFREPGLMGRKVFFAVASHGYEFAPDGFGIRGAVVETQAGGEATLKIRRLNIAERLYRTTGYGIYRDSVLLGKPTPIAEPLLNAEVTGQDSVLNAIHEGRLYWFYGDTGRVAYALGNFAMSGATTELPDRLDPERGIDLRYFAGPDGFSRPMVEREGEGVVWLSGLVVLPDETGRERMLAYYQRRRGLEAVLENGFVAWDDTKQTFVRTKQVAVEPPLIPQGHAFRRVPDDGHVYFTAPYPALRVKADVASYTELVGYEAYTCLKPGSRRGSKGEVELERDASGRLVWGWKTDTPPLAPKDQAKLVQEGRMKADESPFALRDADTGKPFLLHGGSVAWNAYRKRYVMIASEAFGATMLGEVWYVEADSIEGPWRDARKIITHANKEADAHDFYNPKQHPYLDREGGRIIYLEGTYVNTFSGNKHPTPYYEYNQVMYRLDLGDARLKLPKR